MNDPRYTELQAQYAADRFAEALRPHFNRPINAEGDGFEQRPFLPPITVAFEVKPPPSERLINRGPEAAAEELQPFRIRQTSTTTSSTSSTSSTTTTTTTTTSSTSTTTTTTTPGGGTTSLTGNCCIDIGAPGCGWFNQNHIRCIGCPDVNEEGEPIIGCCSCTEDASTSDFDEESTISFDPDGETAILICCYLQGGGT